jgi:hypothetical protein
MKNHCDSQIGLWIAEELRNGEMEKQESRRNPTWMKVDRFGMENTKQNLSAG